LLWISADPGCGKSVLARRLVDQDLQSESTYTVCYFFFKDNEDQNSLPAALCSILHQLFTSQPGLIKYALTAWGKHGEWVQSEQEELWRILLGAISDPQSRKVVCVFDALDECRDEQRERFVSMLTEFYQKIHSNLAKEGCVKILVTSRPYDEIRTGFKKIPSTLPTIHLRGDKMNDHIREEIDLVVRARVAELAEQRELNETTKQKLEEKLLGMEHRTYLWLYLAIEGIQTVYADSMRPEEESVESLPSSVEDAYEKILARVTSKQEDEAKKILQIVVGARRPLLTEELATALNASVEPDTLEGKIRRLCGLFIFFNNSRAYLIHQTAKEFLMGSSVTGSARWKHCLSLTETERLMAQICINYLVPNDLQEGGANGKHRARGLAHSTEHWPDRFRSISPPSYQDLAIEEYKTKHALLDYAANYWISHVQDGNIIGSALDTRVAKLCDIGDGVACAWFQVYRTSMYRPQLGEHAHGRQSKNGLYWSVVLGVVGAARFFLDANGAASNNGEDIDYISTEAAKNTKCGAELTALLLDRRGADVQITQEVVVAAAENWLNGKDIMTLLLDRRSADVQITQEVVVAIIQNFDKNTVAFLLDCRGADVQITQEVVVAAAGNRRNGKDVMTLLLDCRGADVQITEEVVVAAAGNWENGKDIMTLLLDRRSADVQITEEVVVAIIQNFDKNAVALLLDCRGANVQITQEVVVAAAGNGRNGKGVMTLLLDRRSADVQITEEVVVAAAGNRGYGKDVMTLLLDRRSADVQITQEVVVAAAGNGGNGKDVMTLLHHATSIDVTDAVIEAAATSGQESLLCLFDEWAGTKVVAQHWILIARLCGAASDGDAEAVVHLAKQGVPVDSKDICGATPLWHAASEGHTEAVRALLATNAVDVNVTDIHGRTPLFWPAADGYVEIVKLLLGHGAQQDYVDKEGKSPCMVARSYGQARVLDLLANNDN
jgi:hypothetical protein